MAVNIRLRRTETWSDVAGMGKYTKLGGFYGG